MWFHAIPDGRVLLRSKGNFFQRPAFRGPGNRLFASWGSGFIRIGAGDATSNPLVSVEAYDLPFVLNADAMRNPLVPTEFTE